MKTALRLVVGALALAVLSTGMASVSDASATTPTITASSAGNIGGGGASFPYDQYKKWIDDITALSPSVGFGSDSGSKLVLSYTKSSSGTGKSNFYGSSARKASQMFSGTDSLVSESDKATINTNIGGNSITGRDSWTQIPMTAGPIAVITNLPGVTANIKLDGPTICKIYTGQIKVWNDAAIQALNPTIKALKTMTQTIVPVARDSTSGTTFIFVSFLATAPNVVNKCGYTSDWTNSVTDLSTLSGTVSPADAVMSTRFAAMRAANSAGNIQGKTGNDGVRNYVSATAYSIGYVEMAYSYADNVRQAAIKNNATPAAYLLPTQSGANAAIAAQNAVAINPASSAAQVAASNPVNPASTYLQPVNQPGATSYPIVGYSWVLLYKQFASSVAQAPTKGQVEGLIYFLNWSLTKGGVYTSGTTKCYSPLPASVKTLVIAELKKVKYDNGTTNVTVWR
jgi:phosphate transport system substrate-binding protein